MLLTIQIVNYKSRKNLADCLKSIEKNIPREVYSQIIVVNNEAEPLGDETKFLSGVEIIEAGGNLGFGKAHNLGAKNACGEFILFLNPDAKILPGSVPRLIDTFKVDEEIGITGPLLVGDNGKAEEEHFGSAKTPFSLVKSKIFKEDERILGLRRVDWISGGAMMVRKEIFDEVGGFDENYFMYFEDVDLCLRARKKGYRVVLNPEARIFHKSGQSFSSSRRKKRHYYVSQDYYLRKHFGPWRAGIARLLRLPFYVKNVYFSK